MNRSTEVALHHLGNVRKKLSEYLDEVNLSAGEIRAFRRSIYHIDAEITALVSAEAQRTDAHQRMVEAVRVDVEVK